MQELEKILDSAPETTGTLSAHECPKRGRTHMVAMAKGMTVLAMAVLPGGLILLCLYVLARVIVERMNLQQNGSSGQRLARAVASIRFKDVVQQTRKSL